VSENGRMKQHSELVGQGVILDYVSEISVSPRKKSMKRLVELLCRSINKKYESE
jgi:hypothetical protein